MTEQTPCSKNIEEAAKCNEDCPEEVFKICINKRQEYLMLNLKQETTYDIMKGHRDGFNR